MGFACGHFSQSLKFHIGLALVIIGCFELPLDVLVTIACSELPLNALSCHWIFLVTIGCSELPLDVLVAIECSSHHWMF